MFIQKCKNNILQYLDPKYSRMKVSTRVHHRCLSIAVPIHFTHLHPVSLKLILI